MQYAATHDDSPLGKDDQCFIQAVTGTLLYFRRVMDSTICMALSAIVAQQAKPTDMTMVQVKQFLDYCATHEDEKAI